MRNLDTASILHQYEGRDEWVECNYSGRPFYIRVLKLYDALGVCEANVIPAHEVGQLGGVRAHTKYSSKIRYADIEFSDPINTISTDDMYANDRFGNEVVDRKVADLFASMAGSDLWLKVSDYRGSEFEYMKIESMDGDVITAQFISADYIDSIVDHPDFEDECAPYGDYYDSPSDSIDWATSHIDSLRVVEPIEVIDDDEMQSVIEIGDTNYAEWMEAYYYGQ